MQKIPLNLIKKALKKAGAKRVTKPAQQELAKIIAEKISMIARLAVKNAEYSGRKSIKAEDVKKALNELDK